MNAGNDDDEDDDEDADVFSIILMFLLPQILTGALKSVVDVCILFCVESEYKTHTQLCFLLSLCSLNIDFCIFS